MSDWRTIYFDLCKEIEILELESEEKFLQHKRITKMLVEQTKPATRLVTNYDAMPGADRVALKVEMMWKQLNVLQSELDEINDILSLKCEYKKRIEGRMGEFKGIEHQVAVLRDIDRKPLYEIADELGFSYDWIRRISCRVKRVKSTA